ncbi:hypothetical protein FRACYDRAFT_271984 [Fragilariopsis cylindrus CCMP1102]|uniref:Uncharacterized protein n=1 Tax=Fragilariopsis cylindrus CCMP1102 TaxID=635003 RepID=A0A1E7ENE6_9STRA|nr:hypothetical protein FRACYDRAFT_271984 [Fragilariopsis cylindrus CCMP1102]|eukprot:OEU07336.1 hypothetical protein FRACYDRAFT_271984 [Fragilariopsis cylindrus CCMP1102]
MNCFLPLILSSSLLRRCVIQCLSYRPISLSFCIPDRQNNPLYAIIGKPLCLSFGSNAYN